jgi:dienelactone hydrolase
MKKVVCLMLLAVGWQSASATETTVTYRSGGLTLTASLCLPEATGPRPAVVFNHGGFGSHIGGAPEETCRALAKAGVVGFSPIRRQEKALMANLDDVLAAVAYVRELPEVDVSRIAIMGFSRGALLTTLAVSRHPDDFAAVVLMAPAPPRPGTERDFYAQAQAIRAPVLLLVAENDLPQHNNEHQDHVALTKRLRDHLADGGREARLIIYPPYGSNGHMMFFEVGDYWSDIVEFLQEHL